MRTFFFPQISSHFVTRSLIACLSLSCIQFASAAQDSKPATAAQVYTFDVPHTQIYFSVNHLGFSNSSALLSLKEGTLTLDQANMSNSKAEVTIDVASLQFGDKKWNEHMADKQFFNTAAFPNIEFVSSKVTMSSATAGKLTGNLTVLGVSKPITLDFVVNKIDINPMSKKPYAGFSATGSLKRSDFGMVAYLPSIGDDVKIRIEAEAGIK